MNVPKFELSEDDESAMRIARTYLESVTQGGLRITTVDVARWCIHRAAAGVIEEMAQQVSGGENGNGS